MRTRPKTNDKSTSPLVDDVPAEGTGATAERKEKVLHARIPHSLDREIKRRAQHLGLSVSTVVRQVLLNTFDLVEDIVADSTNLALSITGGDSLRVDRGNRRRDSSEQAGEVLGWQEAVLNRNALCGDCNGILAKGTRAAIGIRETPGPQTILCLACLDSVTNAPSADSSKDPAPRPSRGAAKHRGDRKSRATKRSS